MNDKKDFLLDMQIDRAADAIREDRLTADQVDQAAGRVALQLGLAAGDGHRSLESCAEYQALIPAAIDGTLEGGRALLVEAHLRECLACRRAWKTARSGAPQPAEIQTVKRRGWGRWVAAAAAALLLVGGGAILIQKTTLLEAPRRAKVQLADGLLLRVSNQVPAPIQQGAQFAFGEEIRTTKESGAIVELADGSRIEMRERTAMTLGTLGRDTDIRLAGGSVIVQASKQGSGHLYVTTPECRVAVTGTVFSVDQGTLGSRVSVLEGEVHVTQGDQKSILHPGDQYRSTKQLEPVSLADEISWSRNREQLSALIKEFKELQRDIDRIPDPALRTSTRLLDLVPPDTVVFGSMPNLSGKIDEAYQLFQQRLSSSPVIREWWEKNVSSHSAAAIEKMLAEVRLFGPQLGEELVLSVQPGSAAEPVPSVLFLTTLTHPREFRSLFIQETAALNSRSAGMELMLVDDLSQVSGDRKNGRLLWWIHDDILAVAPQVDVLQKFSENLNDRGFATTEFHAALAKGYETGAGWLGGVDVHSLMTGALSHHGGGELEKQKAQETLERSGFNGARFLVFERRGEGENLQNQVTLSFAGPRQGLASWLAAPAPMRSLGFISPDANIVAAGVSKNPSQMLSDIRRMFGGSSPELEGTLEQVNSFLGMDLDQDLLETLGGEFAAALDGPVLPVPSWKVILEVNDPARLQNSMERLVPRMSQEAVAKGGPGMVAETRDINGRKFYSIRTANDSFSVHYTFADGYMIIAPHPALLEKALAVKAAGLSFAGSSKFIKALPAGRSANLSAFIYKDLSALAEPLSGFLEKGSSSSGAEGAPGLALLLQQGPSLHCVYGEESLITIATKDDQLQWLPMMAIFEAGDRQHTGHGPSQN